MTDEKRLNEPCREKFWHEMDADQKLESLREVLVWIARDFQEVQRGIEQLAQHQHDANGALVAPLYVRGHHGLANEGGYRPDYASKLARNKE